MIPRPSTRHLGVALLLVLVGLLFAPTLAWLVRSWQVHPYYTHGALIPLVAVWLVWRARDRFTVDSPSDAGITLIAAGTALHLASLRWAAHPVSAVGLLVVLLGLALLIAGRAGLRAVLFPVALLVFAIPVPMVERLAPPLAAVVARGAAAAAGMVGVVVAQAGAQLDVGGGAFTIGAPCSGLRSLVALGTLAFVLAGLTDGPRPQRAALVVAALPLALTVNWARLTGLLWAADTFGAERGLYLFHTMSSPLLFVAATLGLLVVGRALGCDVRIVR